MSLIPTINGTSHVKLKNKLIYQYWYLPNQPRYFWLIAELDPLEEMAWGYISLGNMEDADWGYVRLNELARIGGVEDPTWEPWEFQDAFYKVWDIQGLPVKA